MSAKASPCWTRGRIAGAIVGSALGVLSLVLAWDMRAKRAVECTVRCAQHAGLRSIIHRSYPSCVCWDGRLIPLGAAR